VAVSRGSSGMRTSAAAPAEPDAPGGWEEGAQGSVRGVLEGCVSKYAVGGGWVQGVSEGLVAT
jgi:hypothetical protein